MFFKEKQTKSFKFGYIETFGVGVSGLSTNISTVLATALSTGSENGTAVTLQVSANMYQEGVKTTSPLNRVLLYATSTGNFVTDSLGRIVFGILTESSGTYTVTFYSRNSSGSQVAYNMTVPTDITFGIPYNFKWKDFAVTKTESFRNKFFPSDKFLDRFVNNFYSEVTGTVRFITTNSTTGKLETGNIFNASTIPFSDGSYVATNVAAALIEVRALPLPGTITQDIVMGDTHVITGESGNGTLNFYYSSTDQVLLSSNSSQSAGWVLTQPTRCRIGFSTTAYVDVANNFVTLYGSRLSVGTNSEIEFRDNGSSYTSTNVDRTIVLLSGRNVTVNSGVVNTVGAGLSSGTIKTSNALYANKIAFINGSYETILISSTLGADTVVNLPDATSKLTYTTSTPTNGVIPIFDFTEGTKSKITGSIITQNSGGQLGINASIVSTILASFGAYNIAGVNTGISIASNGGLGTVNTAILLNAENGSVSNYALHSINGDIYVENGNVAFGTTPVTTNKFTVNTSTGNFAGAFTNSKASGTSNALSGTASGAGSVNIGGIFSATGATTNYGLLVTAGRIGFGTATPNASALLDLTSTTQGLLVPRMTSGQRTGISSPANGLIVYDTTTSQYWGYVSGVWTAFSVGIPSLITQDLNLDVSYSITFANSTFTNSLITDTLTGDQSILLPNASGTIALTANTTNKLARYVAGIYQDSIIEDNGTTIGIHTSPTSTAIVTLQTVGGGGSVTTGLYISSSLTTATQYGINLLLNGAATNNIGVNLDVSGAGTSNVALRAVNGDIVVTGGGIMAGAITANVKVQITARSTDTKALNILNTNTSGTQYGSYTTLSGASTNNIGAYYAVSGAGTANYAIQAQTGDIYVVNGNTGLGVTPATTSKLKVTADSVNTNGILITNSNTTGTQYSINASTTGGGGTNHYGALFTVSGAVTLSVGVQATVSNGTTAYGGIFTADTVGTTAIGIKASAVNATNNVAIYVANGEGGLVVGKVDPTIGASVLADFASTTKAVLVPRIADPVASITTPINGMIIYNTGTDKFQGYAAGAWANLN